MPRRDVIRSLLLHQRTSTLQTLALSTFLLASPLFAQGPAGGQATDTQVAGTTVVAENSGGGDLSAQDSQAQSSSIPNAPSSSQAVSSQSGALTFGQRAGIYGRTIFRPYTLVGPALGAGIGQWEDEPPEWKQGGEGYGRRLASGVGRSLISETVRFGVAAIDGEDPRYHRSDETGVWNRTKHVIVETFTSQTASGTRIPAYSRFAGTYGAAFVSNLWYPDSRATPSWALRRGSTALGSSLGFHLFEEFMPRKYFKTLHMQD